MAEAGASVCLVQRHPTNGTPPNLHTLTTIRALGGTAQVVYCDLSDLQQVKLVFQTALDVMGGDISVLVNCAGIQRRSPSLDFPENDWDDVCIFPFNLKNPVPLYSNPQSAHILDRISFLPMRLVCLFYIGHQSQP